MNTSRGAACSEWPLFPTLAGLEYPAAWEGERGRERGGGREREGERGREREGDD